MKVYSIATVPSDLALRTNTNRQDARNAKLFFKFLATAVEIQNHNKS